MLILEEVIMDKYIHFIQIQRRRRRRYKTVRGKREGITQE